MVIGRMHVVASKSSMNSVVKFTEIATANKEMYRDFLHRLRKAVKRKLLEIWRVNSRFLLYDNAPAHRSVLVKDFLARNNVTTLEHPKYSSELTAADFCLFLRMTSALKGRRFCDDTDIIKNATEELKRLSQNGFQ
jgi:transposase